MKNWSKNGFCKGGSKQRFRKRADGEWFLRVGKGTFRGSKNFYVFSRNRNWLWVILSVRPCTETCCRGQISSPTHVGKCFCSSSFHRCYPYTLAGPDFSTFWSPWVSATVSGSSPVVYCEKRIGAMNFRANFRQNFCHFVRKNVTEMRFDQCASYRSS